MVILEISGNTRVALFRHNARILNLCVSSRADVPDHWLSAVIVACRTRSVGSIL